ncbi:MAG: hypothetical protein ACYCZX_01325 [Rhodospirillaceae bacterium]
MDIRSRQHLISEGYALGRRLRQRGATALQWRENAELWCDGPGRVYRGHEFRPYFARGLEAGYHDLDQPRASSIDQ